MRQCVDVYATPADLDQPARTFLATLRKFLMTAPAKLIGMSALDAAERHLKHLDERTLKDLGFDLRDLPARDQMARRRFEASMLGPVHGSADFWR